MLIEEVNQSVNQIEPRSLEGSTEFWLNWKGFQIATRNTVEPYGMHF